MAGIGNLIPLIILLIVVGGGGFIGYQVYLWSEEMKDRGKKHMEKKNVSFTKDGGLKVGVKEMKDEDYTDKTQNVLVNVWNNAELPNYKSRLGWNSTQGKSPSGSPAPSRPSTGRTPSSSSGRMPTTASTSSSNLRSPDISSSQKRSTSPLPGGWS